MPQPPRAAAVPVRIDGLVCPATKARAVQARAKASHSDVSGRSWSRRAAWRWGHAHRPLWRAMGRRLNSATCFPGTPDAPVGRERPPSRNVMTRIGKKMIIW